MKFYKISNNNLVGLVGEFDFVGYGDDATAYAQSETELPAPFEEVQELPLYVKEQMQTALNDTKLGYLNQAQSKVEGITLFVSDVLGSTHTYDFSMEDQTNLLEAKAYIDALGDSDTVGIRCTAENGIKDNYPHTKAQVSKLFNDWYSVKSSILNAFSTLKIELGSATSKSECESAFTKFSSVFETKSVK